MKRKIFEEKVWELRMGRPKFIKNHEYAIINEDDRSILRGLFTGVSEESAYFDLTEDSENELSGNVSFPLEAFKFVEVIDLGPRFTEKK